MIEIQPIRVEIEGEEDGRVLASVPDLPGVMAYGTTDEEAVRRVKSIADWLESEEASWIPSEVSKARLVELHLCFHDSVEVGPAALAKIANETGLRPEDL
ncbi:MAG TPA: hypothetical protein VGQ49_23475 [Bryobacteraceae bacterium]|jgi:predicted RNase H-like HicB family nuclease|nr:hypothetical protein [Bryobacteraceae bacterium]